MSDKRAASRRAEQGPRFEKQSGLTYIGTMAELPDDWDPTVAIEHALATATETMREDGGFVPFAVTVDSAGETVGIFPQSVDDSGDNISDFEALVEGLREEAEAGDHEAVVLLADTWVRDTPDGERRDAVAIHLEFRDGYAQKILIYYDLEERPGDGKDPYHVELKNSEIEPANSMIFDPA